MSKPESLGAMLQGLRDGLKELGLKPKAIKNQIVTRRRYGLPYSDMSDTEIAEVIIREAGGARELITTLEKDGFENFKKEVN